MYPLDLQLYFLIKALFQSRARFVLRKIHFEGVLNETILEETPDRFIDQRKRKIQHKISEIDLMLNTFNWLLSRHRPWNKGTAFKRAKHEIRPSASEASLSVGDADSCADHRSIERELVNMPVISDYEI